MDVAPPMAATLGSAAGLALEQALQAVSLEARLRSPGADNINLEPEMAERRDGWWP